MNRAVVVFLVLLACASRVHAQDPPPRIPWVVVDLHANVATFPNDAELAASRDVLQSGCRDWAWAATLAHLYPLRWRAVTFGIGAQISTTRAHGAGDRGPASAP